MREYTGLPGPLQTQAARQSDTLLVDFGIPVPAALAGPSDSVCGLSAALAGNSPAKGMGTWSKISGPGNVNFIPTIHSPSVMANIQAGDEGQYTFEWRITSGSCPPKADSTLIYFKPMPGVPAANDLQRCGPGSVVLTATVGTNGDVVHWYKNSSGGALLFSGNSYTTPVINGSTDYWVASYNSITGCESFRRRVHIAINPVPAQPVTQPVQHCGNSSLVSPGCHRCRWNTLTAGMMQPQEATSLLSQLPIQLLYLQVR